MENQTVKTEDQEKVNFFSSTINTKNRELNIDDYKFQEAWREMESDKLKAVLTYIVEKELDEELLEYLEEFSLEDHEKLDMENVSEVASVVEVIKSETVENLKDEVYEPVSYLKL